MLGLRNAPREDTGTSVAEVVFGSLILLLQSITAKMHISSRPATVSKS